MSGTVIFYFFQVLSKLTGASFFKGHSNFAISRAEGALENFRPFLVYY